MDEEVAWVDGEGCRQLVCMCHQEIDNGKVGAVALNTNLGMKPFAAIASSRQVASWYLILSAPQFNSWAGTTNREA